MTRPEVAPRELIEVREGKRRAETAELLHLLASSAESMAQAMDENDDILGLLAGRGIANHLAALPKHVRDVFMEYASDEAAAGYLADQRYYAAEEVMQHERERPAVD